MAPDYEDFQPPLYEYDPFFTAHVSTSMRVPDRIAVAATTPGTNGEGDAQLMEQYNIGRSAEIMNVPDRIVVAGKIASVCVCVCLSVCAFDVQKKIERVCAFKAASDRRCADESQDPLCMCEVCISDMQKATVRVCAFKVASDR